MTHYELANFLARVSSNLQTDYLTIKHHTQELQRNLGDKHLDWNLAHMYGSMMEFLRDLDRHQEYLNKDKNGNNTRVLSTE